MFPLLATCWVGPELESRYTIVLRLVAYAQNDARWHHPRNIGRGQCREQQRAVATEDRSSTKFTNGPNDGLEVIPSSLQW